ncbi:AAA family ATPase [Amycolatopsis benzoatilytica]|uniref:AAA family ATPase n=1 Tax=Amycolatopsis benzoatilytica TaxID=346045 RepID=UPI00037E5103|nr:AAA family ATPase [Amycolatopsis benzoatilytica]
MAQRNKRHQPIAGLTSLVGREAALDELRRLLDRDGVRLVTLHGDGGVGKTRLASELCRTIAGPDGPCPGAGYDAAVFVTLRGLVDADDTASEERPDDDQLRLEQSICQEVAAALELDLHRASNQSVDEFLQVVADHLNDAGPGRFLLVLDDCELLRNEVAEIVEFLLEQVHTLQVVTTSRKSLPVHGEHLVQVRPLQIPAQGATRAAAADTDAVRLFCDRAAAAGSPVGDWSDWPSVVRLVRMSDGVPLVLELLAARLRGGMRSPTAVLHALQDDGTLALSYTDGRRALPRQIPPHHAMLAATVGVSWNDCNPPQQQLWRRLSIFSGGFTLDAACSVCAEDPDDPRSRNEVAEVLEELALGSIVTPVDDGRYTLRHSWIREYGERRLADSDDEPVLRERHCAWIAKLVQNAAEHWFGPGELGCLEQIHQLMPNIGEAVRWCCDTGQIQRGYHLLNSAASVRAHYFYASENRIAGLYNHILVADTAAPTLDRIIALSQLGFTSVVTGDKDSALAHLHNIDELTPLVAGAADSPEVALFRGTYVVLADLDPAGLDMLTRAADEFHRAGKEGARAMAFLLRALGAGLLPGLDDLAQAYVTEAIEHAQAHKSPWAQMWTQWLLALPGLPSPADILAGLLEQVLGVGDAWLSAWCVYLQGIVKARLGDYVTAATLIAAAFSVQQRHGVTFSGLVLLKERQDEAIDNIKANIGATAFDRLYKEGRRLSTSDIYKLAMGPDGSTEVLTPQHLRMISLVAANKTNREIATELNTTETAVSQALTRARKKIGLPGRGRNDRPGLAKWFTANYPDGVPGHTQPYRG